MKPKLHVKDIQSFQRHVQVYSSGVEDPLPIPDSRKQQFFWSHENKFKQ
jgi:hypothetical protein